MKYNTVRNAIFINRPNRFIAHVLLDGLEEVVHVKNTGRCKEILKEGAHVVLEASSSPGRKTGYSLISCYKDENLINIDSQVPNAVVYESILQNKIEDFRDVLLLKKEVIYGNSRFDLFFKEKSGEGFIEVKGVTLEENGTARFPDAPTERGTKHIYEMINAVNNGYKGYIFFLIQMKGTYSFTPNQQMDPEFANALKTAASQGVNILAYDAAVTENEIVLGSPVRVIL